MILEVTVGDKITVNGKECVVIGFTRRDGRTYVKLKEVVGG